MATNDAFDTMDIRVAYRDVDMQGQMHNAAYLTLAEQALVDFWSQRPTVESEPAFAMKRMECVFHKPLHYDDIARLRVEIDKIGMQTVGFAVLIERDGTLAARVEIVWTAYDRDKGEEARLPEALRDWLYDFLP
ncbi:acyl-CoA thioesterase [Rhizobiaceae bacterium BDR2-2]|uniref:Acyl-CoA thioesterase n=1 Tax=Ectorhizobium quercum TaxID=2965071 RepID=A0AAE3STP3_9HYPH|nr:thioesterase family protein [Ectorhizobium quercum]MCX8996365.1 acyl-CoA thioesterase [Ectorhizobium quercum]MCX8998596.1 acyl-CoA thioesterase [Ectorhizobium quercum]